MEITRSNLFYFSLLSCLFPNPCMGCNNPLAGLGREAGAEARAGIQHLSNNLRLISGQLSGSLDKGVDAIRDVVHRLSGSIEEIAKSVQIRIDSRDLALAGADISKNLKEALVQVSKNWHVAISTADLKDFGSEAAKHLSTAIQNINIHLRLTFGIDENTRASIDSIFNSIKLINDRLARSADKGIDAVKETVQELNKVVVQLAENIQVRLDSGDLAHLGADATNNLKQAVEKLTENWKIAIKTEDLRGIGSEAAESLSKAMQNINVQINFLLEIGPNLREAVKDITLVSGLVFATLLLVVFFSCKKCGSTAWPKDCCASCNDLSILDYSSDEEDEEDGEGDKILEMKNANNLNHSNEYYGKNDKNRRTAMF